MNINNNIKSSNTPWHQSFNSVKLAFSSPKIKKRRKVSLTQISRWKQTTKKTYDIAVACPAHSNTKQCSISMTIRYVGKKERPNKTGDTHLIYLTTECCIA